MAEINTQITSLATNLQRVQSQGGQFVDDQGELVGAALRNSFKGKVVKMLVDRGIAREGNLGGRVAVALVGQENFDRLRTSAQELQGDSVCNVLSHLEKLESEGLDSDLKSKVSDAIYSKFSGSTPISELNETALQTLHRTIQDEVLPQRRTYRQKLLGTVDAGHPTRAMQNASQAALLVACRGLEEKLDQAPNLTYKLGQLLEAEALQTTTGQGRSVSEGAASLLHEYQAVSAHLKSGLEGEIRQLERQITEAGAQTDSTQVSGQELQLSQRKRELSQVDDRLRQQFIGVLQQTYAANDIVDGLHVRQDGKGAYAGGEVSWERTNQIWHGKKKPVRFVGSGGVEQKEALSATTGNWAGDFAQDLDEAVTRGDRGEILNYARTLTDIIRGPQYSAADKRMAHILKQNAAFLNDFDCVKEVLGGGKGWRFDQETTEIYKPNAEQLKAVIENKIRESDTLIANPESHPDYEDYQDAFRDPRVGERPRRIDRAPVDETRIISLEEMGVGGRFRPERGGGENPTPTDGRTQIIRDAEETRAIARGLLRLPVFKT